MRLKQLTVECFRGFAQRREFNLDSPFVLLTGPNGRGKTSFFDAIEWALLGKLYRLTGTRDSQGNDYISNAFAGMGAEPRVELVVKDDDGTELIIRRLGHRANLEVIRGVEQYVGDDAERELNSALLRIPMDSGDVHRHLTRTHLLEQETLLDFLRRDKPGDRFDLMSRFLGLGVIRERVEALRTAARECNRQLPVVEKRLSSANQQAEDKKAKLDAAKAAILGLSDIEEHRVLLTRSQEWVRKAASIVGSPLRVPMEAKGIKRDCTDAIAILDVKLKGWSEAKASLNALLERSRDWEILQKEHATYEQELRRARETASQFTERLKVAQDAVTNANAAVSQWQKRVREIKGEQSEIVAFFETGKKMAKGRKDCPLCGQPVTYEALEGHVNAELRKLSEEAVNLSQQLAEAQNRLTKAQETVEDLSREQRDVNNSIAALVSSLSKSAFKQLTTELERYGVRPTDPTAMSTEIAAKIRALENQIAAATETRDHLVQIEAAADAASRALVVKELESQLEESAKELELAKAERRKTQKAYERLDALFRQTKEVERDFLVELLQRYEKVWQDFYYRLQPHPFFTSLKLKLHEGENQELYFEVQPDGGGSAKRANMIFSGGQSAGLMVVLFLTLHLYQNWSKLETVMLDDPLQSMDDVNVLGLIDLLRFFGEHRQVILSTHDDRFATMLLHKFRSLEADRPIYHYAFEGLTRMGPVIDVRPYAPRVSAKNSIYLERLH